MKTSFDCLPCFVQQTIRVSRLFPCSDNQREKIVRQVLGFLAEIDFQQSPPAMSRLVYQTIRDITGIADPYHTLKQECNQFAMQLYPDIKKRIDASSDPFQTALRLAIAGNIIDFGLASEITKESIQHGLDEALHAHLDLSAVESLRKQVQSAETILYLGDNAGEIVFDRAFIELLPLSKVTYVVRGYPIINDVLLQDAEDVGLTNLVKVIDNGHDAPGAILEQCSESFQQRFRDADLIIAKGQGNFETLSEYDRDICFLFKVKCPVVSKYLGIELGRIVIRFHYPS